MVEEQNVKLSITNIQIYIWITYFQWHRCHWEEVHLTVNRKHGWDICDHPFPVSFLTICADGATFNNLWKATSFQILTYYLP